MSERLKKTFKDLMETGKPAILECEVKSLDQEKATCTAQPLDEREPELPQVRLNMVGKECVFYPKVGSYIAVAMLDEHEAAMVAFGELEEAFIKVNDKSLRLTGQAVELNGGKKKGLVELDKLSTEIEKLNKNFELLKQAVSAAPVVPTDGGASFKDSLSAALEGLLKADISKTENKEVLQ